MSCCSAAPFLIVFPHNTQSVRPLPLFELAPFEDEALRWRRCGISTGNRASFHKRGLFFCFFWMRSREILPARRFQRCREHVKIVLGAGLEPACLSAYAPQTYVSAIPPPERVWETEDGR